MADIFISYARPAEGQAQQIAQTLRTAGYSVWRDDELPAHRSYGEVIEERIRTAKAVLVLWSNDAVRSQWVRAEADAARELGTLVQVSLDGVLPPMPFNQIQCADLMGWRGDTGAPGWQKVVSSILSLSGVGLADGEPAPGGRGDAAAQPVMICVLPFHNMSGDGEQEYFSDGISEDIIIDLSKVSALSVVARNAAFALKGAPVDLPSVARDLGATHVLEGSVRKAGSRVRITAELIDCATGGQLWAERYDRDLTDIFAIQDEISKAIVAALRLKLLPKEKKAIEHRGTANPDAYTLYLLARRHWISGNVGSLRRDQLIVRICRQAIALDPNYARAWALLALAQAEIRFWHRLEEDGMTAAERALELDAGIAEAHCVRARFYQSAGDNAAANRELATALKLDPESWEVNKETAHLTFRQGLVRESIPYFEKACALMDTDYHDACMLTTCYEAVGDKDGLIRSAQITIARVEREIAQDPTNGGAMGMGAGALATLGDETRAREWIARALLLEPDNVLMRYNLACALTMQLRDNQAAIEVLEGYFEQTSAHHIRHMLVDPDIDPLREEPRFIALLEKAFARLGTTREQLMGGIAADNAAA
ncbi:TIR domain-containing protein [Sphingomonas flavalba]|uniref:TIR domain-containing protein n=1 Tax=Sphingomonas flavalba TaxID=2559804 RepID=UPI0039DF998C